LVVSDNIIEASWQALVDSIEYLLMKHPAPSRGRSGRGAGVIRIPGGMMKPFVTAVCLLFFSALGAEVVEKIVARVNDEIITMQDIDDKVKDLRG
jgi:hypothetical protein